MSSSSPSAPAIAAAAPESASFSDSSDGASSGREAEPPGRRSAVEDSILASYLQISGGGSSPAVGLSKIRSLLSSSSFPACLICLGRVRHSDPVWSCSSGCHDLFHLVCIQSWASQPPYRPSAAADTWPCPKCRLSYPKTLIPRHYFCFCGNLRDPPLDPWILPHSCGEICGRKLRPECGHECLLLCHPGACPPCPKLVSSRCFCGSSTDARRCAHKEFSCGGRCGRQLPCGSHACPELCHPGQCPPCRIKGVFRCACGRSEEERECCDRGFRCESPCGGMLECQRHKCSRGCHSGPCGSCPLQGKRACPCGKKEYKGMACDADAPTCGSTCDKVLSCGLHRCPERCHRGRCLETCRTVLVKSCRCESLKKEVPCCQDLVCERKCQRMRDCGRHACKRRCCDGDCPPCPEVCGRKLRCNNHKCPSPCHQGSCSPCPLMVSIPCACGETQLEVPCGIEKSQKPPRCSKVCQISRLCRHKSVSKPHKCHYGACPACRMLCGEEMPCGHSCKQRCHGAVPPPNPEFTLKPKKKLIKQIESIPGSPCPPCQEIIWIPCLGQHVGEDRAMLCSKRMRFPCQNLCGNLLSCGNHYCTKSCHALKVLSLNMGHLGHGTEQEQAITSEAESCEDCFLPCQKAREPACPHSCPLPCHSGECPPCKVLVKRSCHCGAMVHVFECTYYNGLPSEDQEKVRSCGGPCHRKLPNCPHLCSEICHPGTCPSSNRCSKKVTLRCACNTLKKESTCHDVLEAILKSGGNPKDMPRNQFGAGLLLCDVGCTSRLKTVDPELQLRKSAVAQTTVDDVMIEPKRRRKRGQIQETKQVPKYQAIKAALWRYFICLLLLIVVITGAYYCYKGLFWLSDWMNEIDERRSMRYQRVV